MSEAAARLSPTTLDALAGNLERGLLVAPFSMMSISRVVSNAERTDAFELMLELQAHGIPERGIAVALRAIASSRRVGESRPAPSLVWSDLDVAGSRDTAVVCRELFRTAEKSILLSTFNLGHKASAGEAKGNPVLKPLASQMRAQPNLVVRLFVNLRRLEHMSASSVQEVEYAFAAWFRREIWPWEEVPQVYYDPRSLEADTACLHAKCVTVDDARAFVTSANLTEAAHTRNIEAGVLIEDPEFARALRLQFESLIDRGLVRRVASGMT